MKLKVTVKIVLVIIFAVCAGYIALGGTTYLGDRSLDYFLMSSFLALVVFTTLNIFSDEECEIRTDTANKMRCLFAYLGILFFLWTIFGIYFIVYKVSGLRSIPKFFIVILLCIMDWR